MPFEIDIAWYISVFGAVIAVFFAYICILVFWKEMARIISETGVFSDLKAVEWIVYGLLFSAHLIMVCFSFAHSDAFYGTEFFYDIIYTSDSPILVKGDVYIVFNHPENDLRQPLFAIFASPFVGIAYLISRLVGATPTVEAILVNSVQVAMLFVAHFMLAKMMKLNHKKRICFMLLTSFTYMQLLFTLMMEQYVVAYCWLIFCIYLIANKPQPNRIALWGAGGTLLTSMILLPLMSSKSPIKNFKSWVIDMVKYGLEFATLIFVFCRFDVIFNLLKNASSLSSFAGGNVALKDKLFQYLAFIHNCFTAPKAGVRIATDGRTSWQMYQILEIDVVGIVIFALVLISVIWNRNKKSSLLAGYWVGFSVIMLFSLGWGTKENGLILYALYFGWAFLVLLFQLVEKIEDKLNIKFLVPVFSIGCSVVLAVVNIPAIMEMVNFAITYFPV